MLQALACDVGTQAGAESIVNDAIAKLGGLDIVVSNAAYSDRELMLEADLEGFKRTIDVTMWGPFYLTRAAAKRMVDAGHSGSIVVISSPHAHLAIPVRWPITWPKLRSIRWQEPLRLNWLTIVFV